MAKKICRKNGISPIQRNWNRMAELSQKGIFQNAIDKSEISYRIDVQNHFANTGEMPADFIEPK